MACMDVTGDAMYVTKENSLIRRAAATSHRANRAVSKIRLYAVSAAPAVSSQTGAGQNLRLSRRCRPYRPRLDAARRVSRRWQCR